MTPTAPPSPMTPPGSGGSQSFTWLPVVIASRLSACSVQKMIRLITRTQRQWQRQLLTHRRANSESAHRALEQGNFTGARDEFARLTELRGTGTATGDAYYNLGVVEWMLKHPAAAVTAWHAALDLLSTQLPAAKTNTNTNSDGEDQDKQDQQGKPKTVSEEEKTASACHVNLANYLLLLHPTPEHLQSALAHLRQATILDPTDGQVRYNYAIALEKSGDLERALENYLRAQEYGVALDVEKLIRNVGGKLMRRAVEAVPSRAETDHTTIE